MLLLQFFEVPRETAGFPQPKSRRILNESGRPDLRGAAAFAVTQLEVKVAQIDEHAKRLAEDEDRIADVEGVDQQQEASADRKEPERNRHHHLAGALRRDPLHDE